MEMGNGVFFIGAALSPSLLYNHATTLLIPNQIIASLSLERDWNRMVWNAAWSQSNGSDLLTGGGGGGGDVVWVEFVWLCSDVQPFPHHCFCFWPWVLELGFQTKSIKLVRSVKFLGFIEWNLGEKSYLESFAGVCSHFVREEEGEFLVSL